MTKNAKIDRNQKAFLKAMKEKFSESPGPVILDDCGIDTQYISIDPAHPTLRGSTFIKQFEITCLYCNRQFMKDFSKLI